LADQILVLDGGRIAAAGTHRTLMDASPVYREIYNSQLGDSRRPAADADRPAPAGEARHG
jgi:ATP-binding cassette subfamily B protein